MQALAAPLPLFASRRNRIWLMLFATVLVSLVILEQLPAWRMAHVSGPALSTSMTVAIFLAALACEYLDSSMGMGYGTTLTPLLMLAGFTPLDIVPVVLLSELLTGLAAGLMHHRDGNVDFLHDAQARRTTLLLALLSGVGALLAVWVAISISKFWLGVVITGIILGMGLIVLATRNRQIPFHAGSIVTIGAIAAFNKGLSGGGYGPLVTSGQVVSGLPAKSAVAVTSVAESLTCLIGVLGYLAAGKQLAWSLALPLAFGALLSVPLATLTVRRLRESTMRGLVGLTTLALGALALFKLFA
jgi:uncharacterized membrane protein YfcA